MPIYVYQCSQCGSQVEKVTTSVLVTVPARISNACAQCQQPTVHERAVTSAAIRTDSSHSSPREAARSSQRGSQEKAVRKANIRAGLTGDGRPMTSLQQRSMQTWGSAFESSHPTLEADREAVASQRKS